MRIICDHCDDPITGTVRRLAGNLNLHPDCLVQLGKAQRDHSTEVSYWSYEPPNSRSTEGKKNLSGASRKLELDATL
jgi:hypothetical protein